MPEHPGIYIGLSEPFEDVKLTRKEQRDLRNHRKAFKASAKKYLADVYGVPADSLSVHIKSNGVDAFPIKRLSMLDALGHTVVEPPKEWENKAAADQDIRHILNAIQKDIENTYRAIISQPHDQRVAEFENAVRAMLADRYGVPEKNVDAYYSESERTVFATITAENKQPIYTATLWG